MPFRRRDRRTSLSFPLNPYEDKSGRKPHQTLGLLLGPGLPAFTAMRQEFLLSSPPDYVLLWQQPELGQEGHSVNSRAMQHSSWSSGHRDERTRRTRSLNKQQPITFPVWNEATECVRHVQHGRQGQEYMEYTWNWGEQGMATGAGGAHWLCWTTPCKNRATKVSTCSKNTKCYENIFLKRDFTFIFHWLGNFSYTGKVRYINKYKFPHE